MKYLLPILLSLSVAPAWAQQPDPVLNHPLTMSVSFAVRAIPQDLQRALRRPYRDEVYGFTVKLNQRETDLTVHFQPTLNSLQGLDYDCHWHGPTAWDCHAAALQQPRSIQPLPRLLTLEQLEAAYKTAFNLYVRHVAPSPTVNGVKIWQMQGLVQIVFENNINGRVGTVNVACRPSAQGSSTFDCRNNPAPGPGQP
ncbi:MAG: hypothetical protein KF802_01885 [Bdellovibrionaceae bacterium]|nr:hypothetical protein [Pseudobdellovibrionaceae bacterium]MBX3033933.1 hypothetical protein [Pseudobdellovibrionaceae bacterium]